MKKFLHRGLGAALALALSVSLLAGCSGRYDPIQEAFGYSKDTVMMKVNGNNVTAGDLYFFMAQNVDYVAQTYAQMGMEVDWSNSAGEMTMDQAVIEQSKQSAVLYSVVAGKAKELGYSVTAEDKAAYEESLASSKEQLGSEDDYNNFLKTMLTCPEDMERLSSVGILYNHMEEGLCREGGEYAPTQKDLDQYVEENDLLRAKHILLTNKDSQTGEELSAAAFAEKKATAEDLAAQLQAITDPEELKAKFDEFIAEYNEDAAMTASPEGYLFSAGKMVPEFEEATRALEFNQVSGVVETDYGCHIILRLDPTEADQVRESVEAKIMDGLVDEWVAEAEVETTEALDKLTTADFYEGLVAYRESLEPAEEETGDAAEEGTEPPAESTGDGAEENKGAAAESSSNQADPAEEAGE